MKPKQLKECKVSTWQRDDKSWNCFIESPTCDYILMHATAKTKKEAIKLCKEKWKKNYGEKPS